MLYIQNWLNNYYVIRTRKIWYGCIDIAFFSYENIILINLTRWPTHLKSRVVINDHSDISEYGSDKNKIAIYKVLVYSTDKALGTYHKELPLIHAFWYRNIIPFILAIKKGVFLTKNE